MSYNGSGTFNINTAGQPVVTGTVISSSVFNALTADLATGLSTAITKDGQTTITANIPMNSYKFTGLAAGTAATDSVRLGQLQAGSATVITVTGTDTYTGTMSPALAAYAAGNMFTFVVPNTNTTACTINIDGLGAKSITRDGSTALVAGDLVANSEVTVIYDGTRFQVLNSNSKTNWTVSNALTLSAGTANGVAYLNGSKALTTGSALTFDGTNLATTGGLSLGSGNNLTWGGVYGANIPTIAGSSSALLFYPAGSTSGEVMRLTSTGLGIGTTSPAYKLDVVGNINAAVTVGVNNSSSGASAISRFIAIGDAGNAVFGMTSSAYTDITGVADSMLLNANSASGGISFALDGVLKMKLDSSGNLGIGVTPSAWGSPFASGVLEFSAGFITGSSANNASRYGMNSYYNGTNYIYKANGFASGYAQSSGQHQWHTAPSGTAGNAISFTQAMTLDASGNLGVGTTSPSARLHSIASANNGTALKVDNPSSSSGYTELLFGVAGLSTSSGYSSYIRSTTNPVNDYGSYLSFGTSAASPSGAPTERARITSGGFSRFSNDATYASATGNYHEMRSDQSSQIITLFSNKNASSPYGIEIDYTALDPNGTGNSFLTCYGTTTLRAGIRSNGGLANFQSNNVDLSDERTKTDIAPAPSYWDKIGALEIVTYKYKDQTHDDVNVGVIAQQVETVEPVWVDSDGFGEKDVPEDGVPLKTVYNKDITFAAIKALQEAMARIEKLEAEVAALKGA